MIFAVLGGHKDDRTADNASFPSLPLLVLVLMILVIGSGIYVVLVMRSRGSWEVKVKSTVTLGSASSIKSSWNFSCPQWS